MRTLQIHIRIALAILCLGTLLLLIIPSGAAAAPNVTYDYTWRDDFTSTNLNPNWGWVREDNSAWSLSENPGYMRITTQQGFLLGAGGDAKNLLLQTAPSGDYQIITHVSYQPTANFQIAGLLLYQDDDNFLMFGRAFCGFCGGNKIYFDHEEAAAAVGSNFATATTEVDEAYLRVVRRGNSYKGYYSEDGTTWTLIGTHTTANTFAPRIGLATETGNQASGGIEADFDYFQLNAKFPVLPYARTDSFSTAALNKRWSWLDEDPSHWSLTARPGFLRITTQPTFMNNKLLQVAPFEVYQVTTKVTFDPTKNFELAGLFLYQDANNSLALGHAFCNLGAPVCNNGGIYFDHVEGGTGVGSNFATALANTTVYLRIVREGDQYSGFYSTNGTAWTLVGRHTYTTAFVPKVGLVTRGSANGGDPEINADYDSFAAACAVLDKPGQMTPLNNSTTTLTKVMLKWYGTPCAPNFHVQLRQDNKTTGALLIDKQVNTVQVKTPSLSKGHAYFWRMRACNGAACGAWSAWFKFTVN